MARAAAEIEATVRSGGLLEPGRPLLVLFSGGRDSTCLLDLAVRICGPGAVSALHVNYGLRAGAVLDERHCATVCADRDVALTVARPDGAERRGNLQDWARRVRYTAAQQAAGTGDVAAGHTASDQLETILYRLISSPSRRALLGMTARAGQLVRPLLDVTREETGAYCAERGLAFRDDPSNDGAAFVRNRIRHELIPLLTELHPGAEANVRRLAGVLALEHTALADWVTDARAGRSQIPLDELRAWPPGLAALLLQELADGALGAPAAGVARRSGEVLAMGSDAKLDLPGGVRAVTEGAILRFERTPPLSR